MAGFRNLPVELLSMMIEDLDPTELRQIRLVCKSLEEISFEIFATEHFDSILVLPTPEALSRLVEICLHSRLHRYVNEVQFCSSILRLSHYRDMELRAQETRLCTESEPLPFPDASQEWQRCANRFSTYVTGEDFPKHLKQVMDVICINSLIILNHYPKLHLDGVFSIEGSLVVGRRRILEDTGEDPFEKSLGLYKGPTWDFSGPNLHTRVCDSILYSTCESGQILELLEVGSIEIEYVRCLADPHKMFGNTLALDCLVMFKISICHQYIESRMTQSVIFLRNFLQILSQLSCLHVGSMNDEMSTIWKDLSMPLLSTLNAGLLSDAGIIGFSTFLDVCKAELRSLNAIIMLNDYDRAVCCLGLFRKLESEFDLCQIHISYNNKVFSAMGRTKVNATLIRMIRWMEPFPLIWLPSDVDTDSDRYWETSEEDSE